MSYFKRIHSNYWNFEDAFTEYKDIFDGDCTKALSAISKTIRPLTNKTAKRWKQNWKDLIKSVNLPEPSISQPEKNSTKETKLLEPSSSQPGNVIINSEQSQNNFNSTIFNNTAELKRKEEFSRENTAEYDRNNSNKRQKADASSNDEIENDDSFHSEDYHPRRKQKYKIINICRDYECDDESTDWFVNGFNVCKGLRTFGVKSLELNDKLDSLSDIRLLSLDHVYAFSQTIEESSTKYLGQQLYQDIASELIDENADIFPLISPVILNHCISISLIRNTKMWVESMKLAGNLIKDTLQSTAEDILYSSIIYKLVAIINDITHGSNIEDTFVHNFAHSILSSLFSCDRYFLQEWANCGLEAEKAYKPDWMASIKPWKTKFNIVIAEIKPPSKENKGIISDFAKLGRQMKLMLDEMIKAGLEEAMSFGMLMGGKNLTLYTMDLKAPGIYRLIEIDELTMVTEFKDFMHLPRTLPILYRFKEKILGVVRKLETLELNKSKGVVIDPPLSASWIRASADLLYPLKESQREFTSRNGISCHVKEFYDCRIAKNCHSELQLPRAIATAAAVLH